MVVSAMFFKKYKGRTLLAIPISSRKCVNASPSCFLMMSSSQRQYVFNDLRQHRHHLGSLKIPSFLMRKQWRYQIVESVLAWRQQGRRDCMSKSEPSRMNNRAIIRQCFAPFTRRIIRCEDRKLCAYVGRPHDRVIV